MSLAKAFFLVASSAFYTVAITPPQPRVLSNAVYKGQAYEYIVRYIAYTAGVMMMTVSFLHAFLLAYPGVQSLPVTPLICPATPSQAHLATFSASFIAGVAILSSGAFIRLWSYHTLGSLFTFEVVVKDDHKLITAGPYGYARHPSYTGMILLTIGAYFMYFGTGGYVAECGIEGTPALAVLGWSWRISSVFGFVSLYRRCSVEDTKLKTHFGGEWLKYREEVPYALVPYIL
ncbi:hypothetical protein BD309DRAFT_857395 [Dichomitus squalens]|uniref:Protein-S-isoprenylcysteine O-methyltransferase n=2 Tax=Dichomitus squalens TaxID=114155 RepID=A0A4Q9Q0G9_9APHY|nr:uncharacterized protein DICSQDRAFT_172170 [Dichomitus squalens LYAD-421 SS1]EJF59380.1 hypothetical protein DICSQDRAFT_172170 [Dichomitus squalens LYAD-421 SS1]TBU46774.1 hypothetical protein BD309DRAFT_857395 [Dichomitus squalens]TBU60489.1 hypothetical protein BD310DRAFT_815014 [Dichomitus squalens]